MKAPPDPTIIIDTREQTPLTFSRFPAERGTLTTGDYSVRGLEDRFSVERKSIPDLASCCVGDNRRRFEAELQRLKGYEFRRLLIVGTRAEVELGRYRSKVAPSSVLGSLGAWECRYGLPVVWAGSERQAAELLETWAWYFWREAWRVFSLAKSVA